jgi:hypothetical protein
MPPHVDFERARPHEFILAHVAIVGSFPRVSALVIGQMPLGGKRHIAVGEITLEGFLSVVYAHMCE